MGCRIILEHVPVSDFNFQDFLLLKKKKNCYINLLSAGALLLEEVATSCGREGIDAIINAARKRFSESQQEKAGGSLFWWKVSRNFSCGYFEIVIFGL